MNEIILDVTLRKEPHLRHELDCITICYKAILLYFGIEIRRHPMCR